MRETDRQTDRQTVRERQNRDRAIDTEKGEKDRQKGKGEDYVER